MLYPLVFKPIYKEMIWGGSAMKKLNRTIPYAQTGESWDITCRPNDMSVVANGPSAGTELGTLISEDRTGVLGTDIIGEFPLLLKVIDANDHLSVQVHPNDVYAQHIEGCAFGKTEIWYILDAPSDAYLIIGLLDGVRREDFEQAITTGNVEDCLHKLPVQKGDIVYIPAGLVHAITKGIMIAEIQQNCDITYRVYDYNRLGLDGRPRQLHIKRSLDVIDFDGALPKTTVKGLSVKEGNNLKTYCIANNYFAIIRYELSGTISERTDPKKFYILTCVAGNCRVRQENAQNGDSEAKKIPNVCLGEGDSVFLPAGMGSYFLDTDSKCTLIKSFVPDIQNDFIKPLLSEGYTQEEISGVIDGH